MIAPEMITGFFASFTMPFWSFMHDYYSTTSEHIPPYDYEFIYGKRNTDPILVAITMARPKYPLLLDSIGLRSDDDQRILAYAVGSTSVPKLQIVSGQDLQFKSKKAININQQIQSGIKANDCVMLLVLVPFGTGYRCLDFHFHQYAYPPRIKMSLCIPEKRWRIV